MVTFYSAKITATINGVSTSIHSWLLQRSGRQVLKLTETTVCKHKQREKNRKHRVTYVYSDILKVASEKYFFRPIDFS